VHNTIQWYYAISSLSLNFVIGALFKIIYCKHLEEPGILITTAFVCNTPYVLNNGTNNEEIIAVRYMVRLEILLNGKKR
jgi:hypothetical protein